MTAKYVHDTHPEVQRRLDAAYRTMTAQQKIARALELTELAHEIALSDIRERFPSEDDRRHQIRLMARFTDPKLLQAAFGFNGIDE